MSSSQPTRNRSRRSPLKAPPLRLAGESLSEELERIRDERIVDSLVMITIAVSFVLFAGLQWLLNVPPSVMFFIGIAYLIGTAAYALFRIRGASRQIKNLRLGRQGELAVAEYLESLGRKGVRALHDLVGEGFNVDHVAVTPQGILAIETKTISKPERGDARVVFDGESVSVDGLRPDRDPIAQARAAATWLRRQLRDALGKDYPVRPVVAYPGWFVEKRGVSRDHDVWVVEPKAIGHFLEHEPVVLSEQDMSQIVYFLKRLARSQATK